MAITCSLLSRGATWDQFKTTGKLRALRQARQQEHPSTEPDGIVKTANNAVRAIDFAVVANIHEAALRAAYLASYWNDPDHEEGGENAFPSLSAACWSFRQFLPIG